jgi:hypothetical protein
MSGTAAFKELAGAAVVECATGAAAGAAAVVFDTEVLRTPRSN